MARLLYARFAVFLAFVLSYNVASGQLMPFAGHITLKPDETVECTSSSEFECIEDRCDQGRWCIQLEDKWVQYGLITCNQSTAERYCNRGLCSKEPLPRCTSPEFICPTIDGTYPDPSNCTRYHICVRGVRRTNTCPPSNVYDHEMGGCKYRRSPSDCVQFRCSNQDGQPVVYPRDDRIYGRCFSGKAYISGRCEEHERYNVATEKCERFCRAAGTQPPDSGICGKFILCAEVAPRRYQPVEMTCGCDQAYDEKEKRCVLNAPCVAETPEIQCNPKEDGGSNDGSGNGGDNSDSGEDGDQTNGAPNVLNNVRNSNCDNTGKRQPRDVEEQSDSHTDARQENNDNGVSKMLSVLVKSKPDNNNINAKNDDNVDRNLIVAHNGNNIGNRGTSNDNIEMQQRENFMRFIFEWIIRIIVGQPPV